MTKLYLAEHQLSLLVLSVSAWLAAGALIGAFHFLTLRWNVRMFAVGQITLAGIGHSARSIRTHCRRACHHRQSFRCLAIARRHRWHPGYTDGRRSIWSAAVIGSPLATKELFTVGPVPITEPVVVTWGLMAALALGGFLATRSLAVAPSRSQTVLEVIVGAIEDQIRDTMRVAPEPYVPMIGTLFVFILDGELVVADSRHRSADGPHRNRCGAWADRVFCDHLFRHSRARRRRLPEDLRGTDHRHDSAQHGRDASRAPSRWSCACSATS